MKFFGIQLGFKNSGFRRGIDEARGDVKKLERDAKSAGGAFSALGGKLLSVFSGAAIGGFFKGIIDRADQIQDMADKFEVPTESLQRMSLVAEQNGASMEDVAGAYQKLIINQSKALGGNTAMEESFADLGISVADLKTLYPEQILEKIGQGSMNAASLVAVLGKNAMALEATLAQLKDANPIGIISDADIQRFAQLKDDSAAIGRVFQSWGATLAGPVAESLVRIVEKMKQMDVSAPPWLKRAGAAVMDTVFPLGAVAKVVNSVLPKSASDKAHRKTPAQIAEEAAARELEKAKEHLEAVRNKADQAAYEAKEAKLAKLRTDKQDQQRDRGRDILSMSSRERAEFRRSERRQRVIEGRADSRFVRDEESRFRGMGMNRKQARQAANESLKQLHDRHDPAVQAAKQYEKDKAQNEKLLNEGLEALKDIRDKFEDLDGPHT